MQRIGGDHRLGARRADEKDVLLVAQHVGEQLGAVAEGLQRQIGTEQAAKMRQAAEQGVVGALQHGTFQAVVEKGARAAHGEQGHQGEAQGGTQDQRRRPGAHGRTSQT
ncbi:hypothetical protein Q3H58_001512 [Pseudomonas psychrotolerans]|nr:hypothetical protein [Pseudomonas psychrotolerans]